MTSKKNLSIKDLKKIYEDTLFCEDEEEGHKYENSFSINQRYPLPKLTADNINKPKHYTQGKIEPIDYINANNMSFNEGNIIKYVTRYKYKNGLEDLKKAKYYLDNIIDNYKT